MLVLRTMPILAAALFSTVFFAAAPSAAQPRSGRTAKSDSAPLIIAPAPSTRPQGYRERYLKKVAKIREHQLTANLRESTKSFTSEIVQTRSYIKPKPRRVSVSKDVIIENMGSVTGTAGIDYLHASPISEPTIAVAEYGMMATGNWYAARSLDGKNFEYVNPYSSFGSDPEGPGFCCDQVTIYDKNRQLMIWFMQGGKSAAGTNSVKFLAAKGREAFEAGQWHQYAFAAPALLGETGLWLDYPDLALSKRYLYATINVFNAQDNYQYTAVLRLPLDAMAEDASVTVQLFKFDVFSLRMTQGNNLDRMYFAGHSDTGELAVFTWVDNDDAPSGEHRVAVERWDQVRYSDTGNAEGPKRHPWIANRCDSRITAGWATDTEIGFAWTAARDNRYFRPHVRVAIIGRSEIDAAGESSSAINAAHEPHIWSNNVGIAYPSAGVNGLGQVGLSIAFAGPRDHPSHAVGYLKRKGAPADWSWQLQVARAGRSGPKKYIQESDTWEVTGIWGDYFSVRPHPTNPRSWVTLGYTIQSQGDETLKAVSEFVAFRAKDLTDANTPVAGTQPVSRQAGSR